MPRINGLGLVIGYTGEYGGARLTLQNRCVSGIVLRVAEAWPTISCRCARTLAEVVIPALQSRAPLRKRIFEFLNASADHCVEMTIRHRRSRTGEERVVANSHF